MTVSPEREFNVGDTVFIKNYHPGDKWLPGVIQKKTGPVSFVVKLTDGRVRRCHQDQICRRSVEVPQDSSVDSEILVPPTEVSSPPTSPELAVPTPETSTEGSNTTDPTPDTAVTAAPSDVSEKMYPKRSRNPVIRFEPTW